MPRWPLRHCLLPPVDLTSVVARELGWGRLAAPIIGEQLRAFGAAQAPLGLLQGGFSAATGPPPLGAVLKQMFTGLDATGTTSITRPSVGSSTCICPVREWLVFS